MAKINRGYISVRESFRHIWRARTPEGEGWQWANPLANPFKTRQFYLPSFRPGLDNFHYGTQFLGAFQPVVDSVFDAADTFRPYKSGKKVGWDLLQPLRGIGNVLEALLQIVYVPLFLLGKLTIMNILMAITAPKGKTLFYVLANTSAAFLIPISWLMNSATKLLRGLTQIATTPLSWLKMIARGFSTLENRGVQRLVDDRSVVRLVKEGEKLQQELQPKPYELGHTDDESLDEKEKATKELKLEAIQQQLAKKYEKAKGAPNIKLSGGYVSIEEQPINKRMPTLNPTDFNGNWLSFFKSAMDDRKTELQEISRTRFGKSAPAA